MYSFTRNYTSHSYYVLQGTTFHIPTMTIWVIQFHITNRLLCWHFLDILYIINIFTVLWISISLVMLNIFFCIYLNQHILFNEMLSFVNCLVWLFYYCFEISLYILDIISVITYVACKCVLPICFSFDLPMDFLKR